MFLEFSPITYNYITIYICCLLSIKWDQLENDEKNKNSFSTTSRESLKFSAIKFFFF